MKDLKTIGITLSVFFAFFLGNNSGLLAQEKDYHAISETRMLGIGLNYLPAHFRFNTADLRESFEIPWAYSIAYKHGLKKSFLRASLNGNYIVRSPRSKDSEMLVAIGMEWPVIRKRLNFNIGADLINYYSSQSGLEWNSKIYGIGVGPAFSLGYDINNKLSLGTELSLFYGTRKFKTTVDNDPSIKERREMFWGTHRFFSLHLYYKFGN